PRSGAVMPLIHFLKAKVNLIRIPTPLLKLTGDPSLLGDENKEARSTFIANHDLIEFFKEYPPTIPLQELISYLAPLLPRFYSIASSPLVSPHTIDLLVSTFTYTHGEKERQGLGSHFLCSAAHLYETPIYTYLQPTSHFILPQDLSAPIIMVGPGTGVAPYRAFLQEREQTKATGKNWLFFGERNKETDYYYESYLSSLEKKGLLQLDLAFSRDQKEKIYVQHLLEKRGSDLWKLINEGSYIYICGDARHMAKDVTSAISSIIETHGNEDPKAYLKMLRQEKRLLLDVY
ncbi:MAG: hypothetical protein KDK76_05905, partial [Chlamydiia bacterium]|nr:hypothetical protein [Chlamydiia bacterium]